MRKIIDIAVREYNAAVRTKAFIVSVVLMPILMGGGIVAHGLLKDQIDISTKRIAVIDHAGDIGESLVQAAKKHNAEDISDPTTGKQVRPKIEIELVKPAPGAEMGAQRVKLSDRVREKELTAWLEIGPNIVHPPQDAPGGSVAYHSKGSVMDEQRRWISMAMNDQVLSLRTREANVDPDVIKNVTAPVPVESLGLVSYDTATGEVSVAKKTNEIAGIMVPMAMMMLIFMLIMMGAQPLLHSVLEEKMQRIAEVLLGSVTPFQLMMGKLLGTIGVTFTVALIYLVGGAIAVDRMHASDYIPMQLLPWFFAYQTAAVFMYGAMFIAVGAACNDLKEAQSLVMPLMMPAMAPLFVWFNVVKEPLSNFSTILSLFPPCTPMLMLLRQATPQGVPTWQPWVGVIAVFVCTFFVVWVAGRVFRVGILMQGKPPKLKDLVRWAVSG